MSDPADTRHPVPYVWLLALVAAVAWWPVSSYWQSDDFFAVHYNADLSQTLADFTGAHYGVDSLVVFYRPMISLAFGLEHLVGLPQPFTSHATNVLAHAVSTVCLARIARRFVSGEVAFFSGLVWALAPSHAGSICWAVGRVDSHTVMWLALSALCITRRCEGRGGWILGIVCGALALGSKELALVLPGVAGVLGFALATENRGGATWRATYPFLILLGAYFAWRTVLFGQPLSGYEANVDVTDAFAGLLTFAIQILNPLTFGGGDVCSDYLFSMPSWLPWLGFLPVLLGVAMVRRRIHLLGIACLFLGCSLPMVATWSATDNPMNLRGFYLPMMPLAVLLASGGWRTAVPALLVFALPFAEMRRDWYRSWQRCATIHAGILEHADAEQNFVSGLPRVNDRGTAIEMHLGIDRLVSPPFHPTHHDVYALRPISQHPKANQIPYGRNHPLPFGKTLDCDGEQVTPVPGRSKLGDLEIQQIGPRLLSIPVLDQLVQDFLAKNAGRAPKGPAAAFVLPGKRSGRYRVTVFTGSGYLTTMVQDSAESGADGKIELGMILYGFLNGDSEQRLGDLLQHGTALDLKPSFPILIEADLDGAGADFQPTHANKTAVYLAIDRAFADWWPN